MSQLSISPVEGHAAKSFPWYEVWLNTVFRPSETTFERIIRDPKATANRGYVWVGLSALVTNMVVGWLSLALGMAVAGGSPPGAGGMIMGAGATAIACGGILGAAFANVSVAISARISQWVAGGLGGRGSYAQLAYSIAAYTAVLIPLSGLVGGFLPFGVILKYVVWLYGAFLAVIATKAVNQFTWGKAVAANLIVFLLGVGLAVTEIWVVFSRASGG